MHRQELTPREAGEAIGIRALSFIASDPDRIGRFLVQSGLGPDSLREAAREPGFLISVLDHLLADESMLLAFCEGEQVRPDNLWAARRALGGRPTEHG